MRLRPFGVILVRQPLPDAVFGRRPRYEMEATMSRGKQQVRKWKPFPRTGRKLSQAGILAGMLFVAAGGWLAGPAFGQDWPWAGGYRPVQPPFPPTFTPGPPAFQVSPAAPLPPEPGPYSDYQLRWRVQRALATDRLLRLLGVHVTVRQGAVSLTGIANTWQDRERAATDAQAAGALAAVNRLRVRGY
jgi:hypothetical protein